MTFSLARIRAFIGAADKLPADEARAAKKAAIAALSASLRQEHAWGRPPIPTACERCGAMCQGVRKAEAHCRKTRAGKGRRKAPAAQKSQHGAS